MEILHELLSKPVHERKVNGMSAGPVSAHSHQVVEAALMEAMEATLPPGHDTVGFVAAEMSRLESLAWAPPPPPEVSVVAEQDGEQGEVKA